MPIYPRYIQLLERGERIFVDREDQQDWFEREVLERQKNKEYRVASWVGIGGQGKSELCAKLRKNLETQIVFQNTFSQLIYAELDMEYPSNREPRSALLSLRLQLRRTAKSPFPAFDTAFSRLLLMENPRIDLRTKHPELFYGDNAILSDLASFGNDVLSEVPGLNLLYKYASRLTGRTKRWWERRGKDILQNIESLRADQLEQRLHIYLGSDLADIISEKPNARCVIFIDSHEALWRGRSQTFGLGRMRSDEWLRDLIAECPKTFFNIFSREQLSWHTVDSDWTNILKHQDLGAIPDKDCNHFLSQAGVESEDIRDRIIASSQGLPYYLHLQLELFEQISANGNRPAIDDFGGSHPLILARFIDHLEQSETDALVALSYLRIIPESVKEYFDKEVWDILDTSLDVSRSRSFMTSRSEGDHAFHIMHALMRTEIQRIEKEDQFHRYKNTHKTLHQVFAKLSHVETPRDVTTQTVAAFADAVHHLYEGDEEFCAEWTLENNHLFAEADRWQSLIDPFSLALKAAWRNKQVAHFVSLIDRLATCSRQLGFFEEAAILFEIVLRAAKEQSDLFDEIEVAQWKSNFGLLKYHIEAYDEAIELYRDAIVVGEAASANFLPQLAEWLSNLANVYHATSNLHEAKALYIRALNITSQSQGVDTPDHALRLHGAGRIHQDLGEYKDAEKFFRLALSVTQDTLGPNHVKVAGRNDDLGRLFRDSGDYEKALKHCKKAVDIGERALGMDHPELAMWLDNLALVHRDLDELDAAEALQRRAIEITRTAHGDNHSHLATWLSNLSLTLKDKGQNAEAAEMLDGVLEVYISHYGENHPWVAVTYANKANLLVDDGQFMKAIEHYRTAKVIYTSLELTDHPNYGRVLHLLAKAQVVIGMPSNAIKHLELAITIYRKHLPHDNLWLSEANDELNALISFE